MCTPHSTPHTDLFSERTGLPWQTCETTLLAERVHNLARQIATKLPAGEFRLKDNLMRATGQLLKWTARGRLRAWTRTMAPTLMFVLPQKMPPRHVLCLQRL